MELMIKKMKETKNNVDSFEAMRRGVLSKKKKKTKTPRL